MQQMISIITLGVAELERARKFYADGLGWRPFTTTGAVMFHTPTVILSLLAWSELARDAITWEEGLGFRGVTIAYCAGSELEVEQVLRQAEQAGGRLVKPAQSACGGYSGYFADPDAHLWQVAFHPQSEFDEVGRVQPPEAKRLCYCR